jgi:hypothetical protein
MFGVNRILSGEIQFYMPSHGMMLVPTAENGRVAR